MISDLSELPQFNLGTELQAPYVWLYHTRGSLEEKLSQLEADDREEVKCFLDILVDVMADEYAAFDSLLSRKLISWSYLEYIFVSTRILCQYPSN